MSVKTCNTSNKPGLKWGDEGKCFAYDPADPKSKERARKKAVNQGVSIGDLAAVKEKIGNLLKKLSGQA